MAEFRLETERLVLRSWRSGDEHPHHDLCNLEVIAAALGRQPSLQESREVVERQQGLQLRYGYCFWVIELPEKRSFAGWCGIKPGEPPIDRETEIGWTIDPAWWGQGIATEAARAVLHWTWRNTAIARIAAITAHSNTRSQAVMGRIGMVRNALGDFNHPDLASDNPLRRHVLYRIGRPA